MSDTSTSPIIMGLLFVLRCLVPLGILLGISYLLRRLELVIDHDEEEGIAAKTDEMQQQPIVSPKSPKQRSSSKATSAAKPKSGKKKPVTPKKKES